jgi:hypothetical protein
VLPQVVVTGHCPEGAAAPDGYGEQLPIPFRLQAWQVPHPALPQQTPSTQYPLMHWLAAVQVCPLGLSAQFLVDPDPWHVNGATQSASAAQLVLQALLLPQTKLLGQVDEVGVAQAPAPVQ